MIRIARVLFLMLFIGAAAAHSLRCFPVVSDEGDVTVRFSFRIGQPAVGVQVRVNGPDGKVIYEGRNANGIVQFAWAGDGPLTITAHDLAHRVVHVIPADRFVNNRG